MTKKTEKRHRAPLELEEVYVSKPDVSHVIRVPVPKRFPKPVPAGHSLKQKKEDRKEELRYTSAITRQRLAAIFASISTLNIAFVSSYYTLASTQMQNETAIEIDEETIHTLEYIPPISSIFGSIISAMVIDVLGPKKTLAFSGIPCMVAWGAIAFARSLPYLYIGTIVIGIFMGMYSVVPQIYICEVAEPQFRGLLSAAPEIAVSLGFMFSHAFGPPMHWRYTSIIFGMIPGLPLMTTLVFMPESPHWLIKRNIYTKAQMSLKYFREKGTDVEEEIREIQNTVIRTNMDNITTMEQLKLFIKPRNMKALVLVSLVFVGKSLSGFAFAIATKNAIFAMANTGTTPVVSAVVVDIVRLFSTITCAILVDPVGRKFVLIFSSFGSCITFVTIGVLLYFRNISDVQEESWLPLVFLLFFVFFSQLGYGTLPWVLSGELIPQAVRQLGTGVAVALYFIIYFVVNSATEGISIRSSYVVFWIYGALNLSGVILGILIPETTGKTLKEIEQHFDVNLGQPRRNMLQE